MPTQQEEREKRFDVMIENIYEFGNYDKNLNPYLKLFMESEISIAVAQREKEIVEMIKEFAEPYENSKWLNEVNAQKIINLITKPNDKQNN